MSNASQRFVMMPHHFRVINVQKHQAGTHNQLDHGNWANKKNRFDHLLERFGYTRETVIDGLLMDDVLAYADAFYGIESTTYALRDYQTDGYRLTNPYLRGNQLEADDYEEINRRYLIASDGSIQSEAIDKVASDKDVQNMFTEWLESEGVDYDGPKRGKEYKELLTQALEESGYQEKVLEILTEQKYIPRTFKNQIEKYDALIEKAPIIMGDKELFRIYNADALQGIEAGDVISDKAFLSTTSKDLTSPKSKELVNFLNSVSEYDGATERVTAVIEPNARKNGKGYSFKHAAASRTFYEKKGAPPLVIWNPETFSLGEMTDLESEVLLPRNTPLLFKGYRQRNNQRVAIFQRQD